MTEILKYISSLSVLKWIVLVLIAGFIGHFGRMAAEAITGKIRARRGKKDVIPDTITKSAVSNPSATNEIADKIL